MKRVRWGLMAAAAVLVLAACEDNSRPQEYQIDQDIYATRGSGAASPANQGPRGFETWRHRDRDTFGYPNP